MCLRSWINWGLYNNTDGSEDGKLENLHRDNKSRSHHCQEAKNAQDEVSNQLRSTVTIEKRKEFVFSRKLERPIYRFPTSDIIQQSEAIDEEDDEQTQHFQRSAFLLSGESFANYEKLLAQDLTKNDSIFPQLFHSLTPFDLQVLTMVYRQMGTEDDVRTLFLEKFKIPYRNPDTGEITNPPDNVARTSEYVMPIFRKIRKPDHCHSMIVDILKLAKLQFNLQSGTRFMRFTTNSLQKRLESEFEAKLLGFNETLHPNLEDDVSEMGGLLSLGYGIVATQWDVTAWNWAGKYGNSVGISLITYNQWLSIWRTRVEEQGGFLRIGWSQEKLDIGILYYIFANSNK